MEVARRFDCVMGGVVLSKFSRSLPIAVFCVAALFLPACYAAKGAVTDVSGKAYDVASLRLAKGLPWIGSLKVVCGDARMSVPFRRVKSMKIDPARITSVDGQPYYGVEITLRGGAVIGGFGGGGALCSVCADNGIKGKVSKSGYSAPFSSLSGVDIYGKGEGQSAQQGGGDEGTEDEEE